MSTHRGDTVLITGASSGIGKVTALHLAELGYDVIGTSRLTARLADLEAEASARGLSVSGVEMDVNSDAAVAGVMAGLIDEHEGVDVLVNNAGYGLWGPVELLSVEEIKAQFETNFFAAVRLIKTVLPGMVKRGSGKIINMSSVEGRLATPFSGAYAASKFALEGMSEALRTELRPFGVFVSVVQPGLFRTEFQKNQVVGEGVESTADVSHYAPYIDAYRAKRGRYEWLVSDPIAVARVVHKIVRSRRPAFRHPVGIEARLGMVGARLIPERIFQALVGRATM
ncbi:MAG: SDR family oxidoreductase [Chloroflexi bacterium]|nr:SDR family oxidoreductase [Chloroflexota bacterium]